MARRAAPDDLKDVRFHNPRLARLGVEAMRLRDLRERAGPLLGAPERVDFLMLLLVQAGRATHMVDFADVPLSRGTVLLVRPGQVQQWRLQPGLEGLLVLVSAEALAPTIARGAVDMKLLALEEWPVASHPSRALFDEAVAEVRRLQADIERFTPTELESSIVWHAWMALLLRLAREREASVASDARNSREAEVHRLFVRELEGGFHRRLSVRDYAKRIGYSESTLARACLAVAGHTAKEAVDRRIALEAKRLLAHSDATVTQVAHRLGFSEPTNFVKFFRRNVGVTPLAFRAEATAHPVKDTSSAAKSTSSRA